MRKLALVAGLVALVAALGSPASAADGGGWQRIRPRGMGWTMRVPASWHAGVWPAVSLQGLYISNQAMKDPCVTDETGTRCGGYPFTQLEDDGVRGSPEWSASSRRPFSLTSEPRSGSLRVFVDPTSIELPRVSTRCCARSGMRGDCTEVLVPREPGPSRFAPAHVQTGQCVIAGPALPR